MNESMSQDLPEDQLEESDLPSNDDEDGTGEDVISEPNEVGNNHVHQTGDRVEELILPSDEGGRERTREEDNCEEQRENPLEQSNLPFDDEGNEQDAETQACDEESKEGQVDDQVDQLLPTSSVTSGEEDAKVDEEDDSDFEPFVQFQPMSSLGGIGEDAKVDGEDDDEDESDFDNEPFVPFQPMPVSNVNNHWLIPNNTVGDCISSSEASWEDAWTAIKAMLWEKLEPTLTPSQSFPTQAACFENILKLESLFTRMERASLYSSIYRMTSNKKNVYRFNTWNSQFYQQYELLFCDLLNRFIVPFITQETIIGTNGIVDKRHEDEQEMQTDQNENDKERSHITKESNNSLTKARSDSFAERLLLGRRVYLWLQKDLAHCCFRALEEQGYIPNRNLPTLLEVAKRCFVEAMFPSSNDPKSNSNTINAMGSDDCKRQMTYLYLQLIRDSYQALNALITSKDEEDLHQFEQSFELVQQARELADIFADASKLLVVANSSRHVIRPGGRIEQHGRNTSVERHLENRTWANMLELLESLLTAAKERKTTCFPFERMLVMSRVSLEMPSAAIVGGPSLLPLLSSLELFSCSVPSESWALLMNGLQQTQFQKLQKLCLSDCALTDAELLNLVDTLETSGQYPEGCSSTLTFLNFSQNKQLSDASVPVLVRLFKLLKKQLGEVNLSGCPNLLSGLRTVSLLPFASNLQIGKIAMRVLDLSDSGLNATLMGSLVQSVIGIRPGTRRVERVKLGPVSIERETTKAKWHVDVRGLEDALEFIVGLDPPKGLVNTNHMSLSNLYCRSRQFGNSMQQILQARGSRSLSVLHLVSCDMGAANIRALGIGLSAKIRENGGLRDLDLSGCDFSTSMLTELAGLIPDNDSVRKIELGDNPLESSFEGMQALLRSCRGLESLSATGTSENMQLGTTATQVTPLFRQLQEHPSLTSLGMISGRCEPAVIRTMCASLKGMQRLVSLDLRCVRTIIDVGVLVDALAEMVQLRRLFLYDGHVGDRLAYSVDHYSANSPSNEATAEQIATAIDPLEHLVRVELSSGKPPSLVMRKVLLRNAAEKYARTDIPLTRLCTALSVLGEYEHALFICLLSILGEY